MHASFPHAILCTLGQLGALVDFSMPRQAHSDFRAAPGSQHL